MTIYQFAVIGFLAGCLWLLIRDIIIVCFREDPAFRVQTYFVIGVLCSLVGAFLGTLWNL